MIFELGARKFTSPIGYEAFNAIRIPLLLHPGLVFSIRFERFGFQKGDAFFGGVHIVVKMIITMSSE
jgi:hypothetical protein